MLIYVDEMNFISMYGETFCHVLHAVFKRFLSCLSFCISAALFVSNDQKVSPKLLVQNCPRSSAFKSTLFTVCSLSCSI